MHIVVIDGGTLNPGDLSWEPLASLGTYQVYGHSAASEVVPRCLEADAVLTNKVVFDRAVIAALPRLRYIGVTATGYNIIDLAAARERGIVVTNVPTYGTSSVAQMVFALLLELTQRVGHHARTVAEGRWSKSEDFCYWDYPLVELDGLTMGIVGYGRIGRAVARIALAFGMRVLAHDRRPIADDTVKQVDLDTIFSASDVVSLHCPLTPETERFVNAGLLAKMKSTAYLINTSRGMLVDESALAAALNEGRIAGAGLDVLAVEPPPPDNPLLRAPNCYVTPHIAWATQAARKRLLEASIANFQAFVAGAPQNVVG